MAELLLGSSLTEEQLELATAVKQSGAALLALVNDLLDLGRVEAGKLECKRAVFDLRGAILEAVGLMMPAAREKGLELTSKFEESLPRQMLGDKDRIRQIVVNYLHNALKFTDSGRVSVDVRADVLEHGPEEVLIAVHDTGRGIPDEAQGQLFAPFRQADASSTRRHGGLGLGLAISKRIAEVMGGSVGLASRQGSGSTFWVRLPLLPEGHADDNHEKSDAQERSPLPEDNLIDQELVLRY